MAEQTTMARPYAHAAFAHAKQANKLKPWSEALVLLAALSEHPQVEAAITNPDLTKEKIYELMVSLAKDALDEGLKNFLRLLVENKRLSNLAGIARQFLALKDEAENVVEAKMISAFDVSDEEKKKVVAGLKKRLGREINLSCEVDKSLIGGAIIRAGDLVIDSSIASQLEQLAHQLSA